MLGYFVQIEIGEKVLESGNGVEIAGGVRQIQRIAAMARAFGDAYVGCAGLPEGFERRMHQ